MPDAEHTILLVDDEAPILRALQRLFRREGYRILTAEGGEQALTLLADTEDPVSLIISDQRMPGMNGAQFLEQSRKTAPDAIRFLLTGYSDLDAVVASINRGEIQRYLTKPWNDQDLLLQARQAIEQVELRRENHRLLELTRQQNMELQAFNQKLEKKVEARTKAITDKNKKLSRANTALNRSLVDTVRLLASLIQTLNPFLGNQMKDTAKLALQLGRRLGLKSDVLENIELAATIHDIGLIGGSEKLSRKDILEVSSLEATEYRQHPIVGSHARMFAAANGRNAQKGFYKGRPLVEGMGRDHQMIQVCHQSIYRHYAMPLSIGCPGLRRALTNPGSCPPCEGLAWATSGHSPGSRDGNLGKEGSIVYPLP